MVNITKTLQKKRPMPCVVRITAETHKLLKTHCEQNNVKLGDYAEEAIRRALKSDRK